jgi:hypothetical protein
MIKNRTLALVGVAFAGAAFVLSAQAADRGDTTKGDTNKSGMYESGDRGVKAPSSGGSDAAPRVPRKAAGESVMPSRNSPASVSESAPQKTGKEVAAGKVPDDKTMPNPKTPASPNESGPLKDKMK